MAVVTTGYEVFVNSAWKTASKVPAKSPFGVDLVYGENAFETLDAAIAYLNEHPELADPILYIGDKKVTFSDSAGIFKSINSQEIKGSETAKVTLSGGTYTGTGSIAASGELTLTDSPVSATVAGFKNLTINGGSETFTVLGGANKVVHVYDIKNSAKGSTVKDSATVAGKADGILTVNGAKIAMAGGAWGEVNPGYGYDDGVTLDTAAFKSAMPGDPSSIVWNPSDDSVLNYLPGYATVMLTSGAAVALLGGSLDFSHVTDAAYTVAGDGDYLSSLNKTISYTRKNSGKLTVTDSVIGEATGYATVAVTGASTDFESLDDNGVAVTVKTTYKDTRSARNTTVKETMEAAENDTANGTLTVEGIGFGGAAARDVEGFAKVTVKDARLGRVRAIGGKYAMTSSTETVTTPVAGGGSSVKMTTTETLSENSTAGGTLTTAKDSTGAEFVDIMGFSKVDLVNAAVGQDIRVAGGGRLGSYSSSTTATTIDGDLVQSKTVRKEDYAAAGAVTMSGGSVGWRIEGAATVKLTGTTVGEGIDDGGTMKEDYSDELSVNSKTGALTSSYSASSAGQLKGAVTMTGGEVTGTSGTVGYIIGYQTVTLDGAIVSGFINDYDSYRTTFSAYKNEYSDSGVTLAKQTWSSGFSYAPTAVLTLNNGAVVSGRAYGVKTLTLGSGAELASGSYVEMRDGGIKESSSVTGKNGLYTETYQYSSGNGAPGTVTATGATVGDLRAAGKVTATDATIGYIDGYSSFQQEKITRVGSSLFSGYDGRYFVNPASGAISVNSSYTESENAVGNATLTRTTAHNLYGVGTVKLTEGSIASASVRNSKYIYSCVSSATASNAVTSNTWGTVGTFTATSAAVGGSISGYSTVTLDHTIVGGGVGGSEYDGCRFGSMNISSSIKQTFDKDGATLLTQNFASASSYAPAVALTLKNGAFVTGNAGGIKKLDIAAGTVVEGNVYMADYAMKQSAAITGDKKSGLYEQKEQYTSSQGAAGNATIIGTAGSMDDVCGNISGAAKVTATDAVIGDLTNYCNVWSYSFVRKGAELTSYYGSRCISDPTEYTSSLSFAVNASGNATLTRTTAGRIVNYATVKMTDGEIIEAYGGNYASANSTTLKDGEYTFSHTTTSGVLGDFTATGALITGNDNVLNRFAKVTLVGCYLTGADTAIIGGSDTLTMSGSGATLDEAMADANANATSTFAAAGTLTATSSFMADGVVSNYATVTLTDCYFGGVVVDDGNTAKTALTLAGDNYLYGPVVNVANVTVKSGASEIAGYFGTDGDDVLSVNANTDLVATGSWDFGAGSDKAVVNGTLRLLGDLYNQDQLALSGSGIVATTTAKYADIIYRYYTGELGDVTFSGKLELIDAGKLDADALAIRTRKEELADNAVNGARKFTGEDMDGWLSGIEDPDMGRFADTEDWIKFTAADDEFYEVALNDVSRSGDLSVELYRKGVKIRDVEWDDVGECFDVGALEAGVEHQLRLTTAADTSAFSYVFWDRGLA